MSRPVSALAAMRFARGYTSHLLDSIPASRWFERAGGVSNVAWQVGHLAVAQLNLGLIRVRGPLPIDDDFHQRRSYRRLIVY